MDVSVHHIPPTRLRIAEHRVVAERHDASVDNDFLDRLDALEIVSDLDAPHPRMVVVANDKMLASMQDLEDRFDRCCAEEKVADDVHLVAFTDLRVPAREQLRVHFLRCGERTLAQPNDIEVSKMLV